MGQVSGHADRASRERPATAVGAGVMIRGDVEGVTDLHVQGMIVGKVAVADLIVDDDAVIDGPVTATAVVIAGRVIGPIKARSVHLAATARMEGDVTCESIQIEAGARFTGRCIAEDAFDEKVVPILRAAPEEDSGLGDAGQELLRLAARLRQVT